jgi:formylglycine-generating enzyme required for sulfatase activity
MPTATPEPTPTQASAATPTAVPTLPRTPLPKTGVTRVRETDGAVMVYVLAGEFWMGSTEKELDAVLAGCASCDRTKFTPELTRHKVRVEAFWIDRTEVTNAQYRQCVDAGACSPPQAANSLTRESYYDHPEYDDYPVVNVTWSQARAYAEWAGGRLPTEAEWEYAARGPEGGSYPWGEDPPNERLLNYGRKVGDTTPVGAYPEGASWVGALDMGGNVWEWTSSLYKDYPYDAEDGREDPGVEGAHVSRGGAFRNQSRHVRCAFRLKDVAGFWSEFIGFRIVLPSPGLTPF